MRSKTNAPNKHGVTFSVSVAMCSGILTLLINLLISLYGADILISLFGREVFKNEWCVVLADSFLYLLLIIPAGLFASLLFKRNPVSPLQKCPGTPRLSLLYIPMTIGLLYLLNLVINISFGDLFAPFDSPVNTDTYPITVPGMILHFVQLAVLPAIFEEWLYRGIILENLKTNIGSSSAIAVSALIFGLMHLNPPQSIFAFGFGLFAGYVYVKTGSIWYGVLIHFTNNLISGVIDYWYNLFEVEAVQTGLGLFTLGMIALSVLSLVIYVSTYAKHRKYHYSTVEERSLPEPKAVSRSILGNPTLYLLCIMYAFLLWFFFLMPSV